MCLSNVWRLEDTFVEPLLTLSGISSTSPSLETVTVGLESFEDMLPLFSMFLVVLN